MSEYCIECQKLGLYKKGTGHHIVPKKLAPYMAHVPINIAILCQEHHNSKAAGIHHNKKMMLKYIQEFQLRLELMFTKEFYTHKEIRSLIKASDNSVKAITKGLILHKEGYKKQDLIYRMMGEKDFLKELG